MSSWPTGQTTVRYLLERARLERVVATDTDGANRLASRASLRLVGAKAALEAGNIEGAYVSVYDAYRIAADGLLIRQGLRAVAGEGSHGAIEDAISAQFSDSIPEYSKRLFSRFRRTRHSLQYSDPLSPATVLGDAAWAIDTARAAIVGAAEILQTGTLDLFTPAD